MTMVAELRDSRGGTRPEASDISSRSETCRSARRGLAYYVRRFNGWREKMGAASLPSAEKGKVRTARTGSCLRLRYLAARWREKAESARADFELWHHYQYAWRDWLPPKWQRIIQCETGSRHDWNSGTYEGSYGFWYGTWDAFKPAGAPSAAYLATPREQYLCALRVWRRYGYGAWGCGSA